MSKSKGNVINPDEYVKKFGADVLRTYLGFIGPFTQGGDFQDSGIEGIDRFLRRVWKLVVGCQLSAVKELDKKREAFMHNTVKGVTEDMEELRFNTAIAKMMSYYNFLIDQKEISKAEIEVLLKLLAPFAPHMTEELYQQLSGNSKFEIRNSKFSSIHKQPWPEFDEGKIVSDVVTIAVQVNGKLRDTIETQNSKIKSQKEMENLSMDKQNVRRQLEGKEIKKVIYVPGKILNFVVS